MEYGIQRLEVFKSSNVSEIVSLALLLALHRLLHLAPSLSSVVALVISDIDYLYPR